MASKAPVGVQNSQEYLKSSFLALWRIAPVWCFPSLRHCSGVMVGGAGLSRKASCSAAHLRNEPGRAKTCLVISRPGPSTKLVTGKHLSSQHGFNSPGSSG